MKIFEQYRWGDDKIHAMRFIQSVVPVLYPYLVSLFVAVPVFFRFLYINIYLFVSVSVLISIWSVHSSDFVSVLSGHSSHYFLPFSPLSLYHPCLMKFYSGRIALTRNYEAKRESALKIAPTLDRMGDQLESMNGKIPYLKHARNYVIRA